MTQSEHRAMALVLSQPGFTVSQAWNGYLLHDCMYKGKSIMYKDIK